MISWRGEDTATSTGARRTWLVATLIMLALAASIVGLKNGFTYDDRYIIETNLNIHSLSGAWRLFTQSYWPKDYGGDAYRPLTMLFFSVEWALGRGSPVSFHATNIALYVANTIALFALASLLLPVWGAWLAAALFAVHPAHVEVVANGVGQSELMVGLATTVACFLYIRARRAGPLTGRVSLAIIALYAAGCLAKEHGLVLPGLLLFAELLLVDDRRPILSRAREHRSLALGLVLVAVAFLAARMYVVSQGGAAGFRAFPAFAALKVGGVDRALTLVSLAPEWMRLLFWPARLSSDYAPPYFAVAQGPSLDQLPGFLLLIGTLGLAIGLRRRLPLASFGIAWAAISLAPTINFIPLAERTLFLPTVGMMLAVAASIVWIAPRVQVGWLRTALATAVVVILLAGVARSTTRTMDWHDTDRLLRRTVADFPDSYHAHLMLGGHAFEHQRLQEGERELQRAFALFPYDALAPFWLAEQYRKAGLCPQAIKYYRATQAIVEDMGNIGHAKCLVNEGAYASARAQIRTALQHDGDARHLHQLLLWVQAEAAADSAKTLSSLRMEAAGKLPESMQKTAMPTNSVTEKRN